MLAFDSNSAIKLRLTKIQRGGAGGRDEAKLTIRKKMNAASEAAATLMKGGTIECIIDLYHEHVTASILCLSAVASTASRDHGGRKTDVEASPTRVAS